MLIGLVVSVVTHLAVLLPMLVTFMTSRAETRTVVGRFEPEHFRPENPPADHEPEVKLGIEEGSPSTMTWIGYEQYEEHLARLAETEQAAFTDDPVASEGDPQSTPTQPQPPAEAQPAPPTQTPPVPEQEQQPESEAAEQEVTAEEQPTPQPAPADVVPGVPADPVDVTAAPILLDAQDTDDAQMVLADVEDDAQQAREAEQRIETEEEGEVGRQKPQETEPQPQQQQPAQQQQPQDPVPPQKPPAVPGQPNPADKADKDSDATSMVDVPLDRIKAGKPVAAQGLEIKPQRPAFTVLMSLTSAPGNPLVQINFGRDGKPGKPRPVILRSSGDRRVDDVILASLFKWKAKGKPLLELKGAETIPVRLMIVLNARAAARGR